MKPRLEPKVYRFSTNIRWIGFRKGIVLSDDKNRIEVACPPEFGGHRGLWTAEHLFVAAIETCIMTTFKWLFEKEAGKLVTYESRAVGEAQMINDDFRFSQVEINPAIVVMDDTDFSKARSAIENAHKQCLVSKALNVEIKVSPTIRAK